MKIVFLLSRVPWPLDKGDKLRAFYQMKQLSENHEITLIALSDSDNDNNADAVLSQFCSEVFILKINRFKRLINIARAFLTGLPLQTGYFYSSGFHKSINHIIETRNPDVVFFQLVRMAEYGRGIKYRRIIDYQDALSEGLRRRFNTTGGLFGQVLRIEYKRMVRYENKVFDRFDEKIIITEADRRFIKHPEKDKIHIVPNGIDTDKFYPRNITKTHDIIFAGNMNYPPNIDAAVFLVNEILPLVREKIPDVTLLLAGANPAYAVSSLKSENITVTGWVDDMAATYNSARVFIAPMRIGTGLQNKLLEAMATRLPAVTTSLANKALNAEDKKEIFVGDSAKELANHLVNLLSDSNLYNDISTAGYNFVHENYSWKKVGKLLEDVFNR